MKVSMNSSSGDISQEIFLEISYKSFTNCYE